MLDQRLNSSKTGVQPFSHCSPHCIPTYVLVDHYEVPRRSRPSTSTKRVTLLVSLFSRHRWSQILVQLQQCSVENTSMETQQLFNLSGRHRVMMRCSPNLVCCVFRYLPVEHTSMHHCAKYYPSALFLESGHTYPSYGFVLTLVDIPTYRYDGDSLQSNKIAARV